MVAAGAREIEVDHGSVRSVVTADGTHYNADAVVVAGGAWSDTFGDDLGIDIPVAPQRGQIVHLRLPDRNVLSWLVVSTFQSQYLVP